MSPAQYLETVMVLEKTQYGRVWLDALPETHGICIAPSTETTARLASCAFERFGKGTGHPARLNLGDCFAYAVPVQNGAPLLFTGDDFRRTDVPAAVRWSAALIRTASGRSHSTAAARPAG
jgi:ribonuclease VapC